MIDKPFIVIENADGIQVTSKYDNLDDAKEYFDSLEVPGVTELTDASLLVLLKEKTS